MSGKERIRSRAVAAYDFHAGTDTHAYDYFGVHREWDGCYRFRCYAPEACHMALCGDVTAGEPLPMCEAVGGVWEAIVCADIPLEGMCYAFWRDGEALTVDPYARRGLYGDRQGSLVCTESTYVWQDRCWLQERKESRYADRPLNLYEVHLASFATRGGRSNTGGDAYLNYRELGELLARYVSDMGYTHIRLMPLTEHAQDASHGYVAGGYFAPTSRHGTPDDLRAMVDQLHHEKLGAVMDFPIAVNGENGELLDIVCPETQSFLLSAIFFWLREFHLDGISLTGMYRWAEAGGEIYECACRFLSLLCAAVHAEFPDVLIIAGEDIGEMTGEGSLGFDLLDHPCFAGDVLQYLHAGPERRKCLRDLLLRSVSHACDERYLLTFSHVSVCAGHHSLFGQMQGGYLEKFRGVRLALAFQMIHPGKKLLFMGCELGQARAWDDNIPPDWFLGELETHARLICYVRALNRFYREERCLWQGDGGQKGLTVVDVRAAGSESLFAFWRTDAAGNALLAVLNASSEDHCCRCIIGDGAGAYREVFNSDRYAFGGEERIGSGSMIPVESGVLSLEVPAMTAVFLRAHLME